MTIKDILIYLFEVTVCSDEVMMEGKKKDPEMQLQVLFFFF